MLKNANKGRRNRRRMVREGEIDFEGIVEDLEKARPRTIMVSEALERLIRELSRGRERGLVLGQMVEICAARGLVVDEEEIREVLESEEEQPPGGGKPAGEE